MNKKKLWDNNAGYYSMSGYVNVFKEKMYEKNLDFSQIKNVLEIGSGSGLVLKKLSLRYPGTSFYGLDFSDLVYAQSKKLESKNLKFIKNNILNTSFCEDYKEKFDAIISWSTFHYINEKEVFLFLKNVKRMINPRNYVVFLGSVPIIENISYSIKIGIKKIVKIFLMKNNLITKKFDSSDNSNYHSRENLKKLIYKVFNHNINGLTFLKCSDISDNIIFFK